MANDDYGYFGKGSTGYAQYMTAFNRNFGGSSGGGGNHGGGGGDGGGCGRPFDKNWGLDDPTGKSDEEFKRVIEMIRTDVLALRNRFLAR